MSQNALICNSTSAETNKEKGQISENVKMLLHIYKFSPSITCVKKTLRLKKLAKAHKRMLKGSPKLMISIPLVKSDFQNQPQVIFGEN
jgi:hypothetical protein